MHSCRMLLRNPASPAERGQHSWQNRAALHDSLPQLNAHMEELPSRGQATRSQHRCCRRSRLLHPRLPPCLPCRNVPAAA